MFRRRLLKTALASPAALLLASACGRREPAPDFSYTLLDGQRADTRSLRGQVVLVNFWATTCASCVAEMPQLVALHGKLARRGLQTLAVAMKHDPPASVALFAESRRLPFSVVIDNTGAIAQAYGDVRITPSSFLLDKAGRVVFSRIGVPDFADLGRRIEALIAEA